MEERVKKFLTKCSWVVIALFVVRCLILKPITAYDYFGAAGEAISVAIILMGFYNAFLWKFNPLERAPKVMGRYQGKIEFNFTGQYETKDAAVIIKQTLLNIKVQIVTNEITSNTIVSNLVEENHEYVLYYTYITNPKAKFSRENPIQYGTCRLTKSSEDSLSGMYWTSRQTVGDIELQKVNCN